MATENEQTIAEIERLEAEIGRLRYALRSIAEPSGAYSRDPAEYRKNVIDWCIGQQRPPLPKEMGMPKQTVHGIVRDYHSGGSRPYQGILHTVEDTGRHPGSLGDWLQDIPDGHGVIIEIHDTGPHSAAKGYTWRLVKPHTYERVADADPD